MPSGRLWGSCVQTSPLLLVLMKSASESVPRLLHCQQSWFLFLKQETLRSTVGNPPCWSLILLFPTLFLSSKAVCTDKDSALHPTVTIYEIQRAKSIPNPVEESWIQTSIPPYTRQTTFSEAYNLAKFRPMYQYCGVLGHFPVVQTRMVPGFDRIFSRI